MEIARFLSRSLYGIVEVQIESCGLDWKGLHIKPADTRAITWQIS